MADTTIQFRYCTYNINGFGSTELSYIKHLLDLLNIVMIQEHWLNDKQLSHLPFSPGYSVHIIFFMDSSQILHGRPYGGVAIIIPDSLGSSSTFIDSTSNRFSIHLYLFCI